MIINKFINIINLIKNKLTDFYITQQFFSLQIAHVRLDTPNIFLASSLGITMLSVGFITLFISYKADRINALQSI